MSQDDLEMSEFSVKPPFVSLNVSLGNGHSILFKNGAINKKARNYKNEQHPLAAVQLQGSLFQSKV